MSKYFLTNYQTSKNIQKVSYKERHCPPGTEPESFSLEGNKEQETLLERKPQNIFNIFIRDKCGL